MVAPPISSASCTTHVLITVGVDITCSEEKGGRSQVNNGELCVRRTELPVPWRMLPDYGRGDELP